MAISDQQRDKLNNASPVCRDVKIGTEIQNIGKRVAVAQANSAALDVTGLMEDFNALLAKLKAAGLMASS